MNLANETMFIIIYLSDNKSSVLAFHFTTLRSPVSVKNIPFSIIRGNYCRFLQLSCLLDKKEKERKKERKLK